MSKNILHRGEFQIELNKEPAFFTAILPRESTVRQIQQSKEVEQLRPVFHNVYKIKTDPTRLDDVMANLRDSRNVVHHAYHPTGDDVTRYYITDKIIVTFRSGTPITQMEQIIEKHGLKWLRDYSQIENAHLVEVTEAAGKNPIKVSNDLLEHHCVEAAEPNIINRFQRFYDPTDKLFKNQWHLKSSRGIELIDDADVKAALAWDLTRGDRNITVAIIDDGFDLRHPDLNGLDKIVSPRDFVDDDVIPLPTVRHGDFHGTPCAGIAIGEENGEGIMGIAPHCSFLPIRFDLSADDNLLYEIFDYAGSRAHVISCSWGPVPVYAPLSSLLKKQLSKLHKEGGPSGKGCVLVFAAGNNNAPIKDLKNKYFQWYHPNYGILETKGPIVNGHAAHPHVITVAASTSQNLRAAYSNWGEEISVAAPSNNWHPLQPHRKLPGRGIWTADNKSNGIGYTPGSNYTGAFGGTSSATPLVAGIAALVLSKNPSLSAKEVKEIIESSTDKITDSNPDVVLGHHKGEYASDGHSEWFGYGKVNAFKAVQAAADLLEEDETAPPKPVVAKTSNIRLVAALVNPVGIIDKGSERVTIINISNEPVSLQGWSLVDKKGRRDIIGIQNLVPGQILNIFLRKCRLPNRGGIIRLYDNQQRLMDEVVYSKEDINESGWMIKF